MLFNMISRDAYTTLVNNIPANEGPKEPGTLDMKGNETQYQITQRFEK